MQTLATKLDRAKLCELFTDILYVASGKNNLINPIVSNIYEVIDCAHRQSAEVNDFEDAAILTELELNAAFNDALNRCTPTPFIQTMRWVMGSFMLSLKEAFDETDVQRYKKLIENDQTIMVACVKCLEEKKSEKPLESSEVKSFETLVDSVIEDLLIKRRVAPEARFVNAGIVLIQYARSHKGEKPIKSIFKLIERIKKGQESTFLKDKTIITFFKNLLTGLKIALETCFDVAGNHRLIIAQRVIENSLDEITITFNNTDGTARKCLQQARMWVETHSAFTLENVWTLF